MRDELKNSQKVLLLVTRRGKLFCAALSSLGFQDIFSIFTGGDYSDIEGKADHFTRTDFEGNGNT